MAETVSSHQVAAFSTPINGAALDAIIVRGNDNTLRTGYVAHDADPGIHLQSSTLASRPAAGTQGRKWLSADSGSYRLFYDDGASWQELSYLSSAGGTVSGNLTVGTQLFLAAGSPSATSLAKTGDPNTGLYFPTDDVVILAAGGVGVVQADANGAAIANAARILTHGSGSASNERYGGASVGAIATTVYALASDNPTYFIVYGDNGSARFVDVVFNRSTTFTVISATTLSGSPAARTYSKSSSNILLAMASGTYDVRVRGFTFT